MPTKREEIDSPNTYSRRWFDIFLADLDPAFAVTDVAFLSRQLPLPEFRTVLDLCCGTGRHATPMTALGYEVIGLDVAAEALAALRRARTPAFGVRGDMRALPIRDESVDGVICMWQSFGQFAPAVNRAILADVCRVLRPGGRFVLDVYDRVFHEQLPERRALIRGEHRITEERRFEGTRLHVRLSYDIAGGEEGDEFEWNLFSARELAAEGAAVGLELHAECADFDDACSPRGATARMQLIFERSAAGVDIKPCGLETPDGAR